jgi:hypothetical protein
LRELTQFAPLAFRWNCRRQREVQALSQERRQSAPPAGLAGSPLAVAIIITAGFGHGVGPHSDKRKSEASVDFFAGER